VVTPSGKKVSELDTNAAQRKATHHEELPAQIGNFMKDRDSKSIWEATFKPSSGTQPKPLERKVPTIEEIVDLVYYFKYDEKGKTDWISMKHYVDKQSDPEWSNTMAYLMTGKGPGDYGDRLD